MPRCCCERCLHYSETGVIEWYENTDGTYYKEIRSGCNYSECIYTDIESEDEWEGFGRG